MGQHHLIIERKHEKIDKAQLFSINYIKSKESRNWRNLKSFPFAKKIRKNNIVSHNVSEILLQLEKIELFIFLKILKIFNIFPSICLKFVV